MVKSFYLFIIISISFFIFGVNNVNEDSINITRSRKFVAPDTKLELMNLTEDNYLDYSIENLEETIDSSVNLFGMNSGYSYVEPYDSNGNLTSELNNSKYNEYKEIVTNYFEDLDDDALEALEDLRSENTDIDGLLDCVSSNYTVSEGSLSPDISIRVPNGFDKFLNRINSVINPDVELMSLGNNNEIQSTNTTTAVSLYSMLIALGLSTYAVVTLQGGYCTIVTAITAPIIPYLKAILIAAGIVAIAVVLACYWNQINDIFEAIKSSLLQAASNQIAKITAILEGIDTKVSESFADEIITVNGTQIMVARLTVTMSRVLEREIGERKYHKVYMVNSYDEYLFIDPKAIKKNAAIEVLRMNNIQLNVYTFLSSDARELIRDAFPAMSHIYNDINSKCKDGVNRQFVCPHYHAAMGYYFDSNGVLRFTDKKNPHSFYGVPVLIFPQC